MVSRFARHRHLTSKFIIARNDGKRTRTRVHALFATHKAALEASEASRSSQRQCRQTSLEPHLSCHSRSHPHESFSENLEGSSIFEATNLELTNTHFMTLYFSHERFLKFH